jgi:hypothetical protein
MNIVVDLDGVLKSDKDQPIREGVILVGSLSSWNKITYLSSMSTEETKYWLDINKIVDFDRIIDKTVGLVDESLGKRQFNYARSLGLVEMYVTNDPSMWAFAFDQGIPAVMFGVPSYTRPEFRPDAPKRVRAWTDIEEAIEKQNALRTQDARLSRTEALNFE